jgi:hypothetical protein
MLLAYSNAKSTVTVELIRSARKQTAYQSVRAIAARFFVPAMRGIDDLYQSASIVVDAFPRRATG